MAWYRIGSVNLTNGSAVVTGVGTLWSNQCKAGDIFTQDETRLYEIKSVDSDTQITLTEVYAGVTASSATYAIIVAFNATTNADLASRISKLIQNYQTNTDQMVGWLGGVAGGGTNSDGKYPITDFYGNISYVKSPAQLQADYSTFTTTNAAITGGTINGVVIGGVTPAAITGTTGTFTGGLLSVDGIPGSGILTAGQQTTYHGLQWNFFSSNKYGIGINAGADADKLTIHHNGTPVMEFTAGNRVLVAGAVDDGSTFFQVAGTASILNGLTVKAANNPIVFWNDGTGTVAQMIAARPGLFLDYADGGYFGIRNGINGTEVFSVSGAVGDIYTSGALTVKSRALINGAIDDGGTALQVNGDGKFNGNISLNDLRLKFLTTSVNASATAWALRGNDIVYGDFSIRQAISNTADPASGNVRFYVAPSGNVLIGTTTDNGTDALQVAGSGNFSATAGFNNLLISTSGSTAGAQTVYQTATNSTGQWAVGKRDDQLNTAPIGSFVINDKSGNVALSISPSRRLSIGTGADNGTDALQVAGSIYAAGTPTETAALTIGTLGVSGHYASVLNPDVAGQNVAWFKNDGLGIKFGFGSDPYSSTTIFSMQNGGRFLIDTDADNGTDALQVAGSVSLNSSGGSNFLNVQVGGTTRIGLYADTGVSSLDANANPLLLRANSQEVARLTGGHVLIGTTADNGIDALQVAGSINASLGIFSGGSPNKGVHIGPSTNTTGSVDIYANMGSPYAGQLVFGADNSGWLFSIAKNVSGTISDLIQIRDSGLVTMMGRTCINNAADDGSSALQVAGTVYIANDISMPNFGIRSSRTGYKQIQSYSVPLALNNEGGNVLIGTATDNGADALQVSGSGKFSTSVATGNGYVGTSCTVTMAALNTWYVTPHGGQGLVVVRDASTNTVAIFAAGSGQTTAVIYNNITGLTCGYYNGYLAFQITSGATGRIMSVNVVGVS